MWFYVIVGVKIMMKGKLDYTVYVGKWAKIVDIDGQIFRGYIFGAESVEDSEDGQVWLDMEKVDSLVFKYGDILTIAESEIKKITIINK